jgi:hypothetical protein
LRSGLKFDSFGIPNTKNRIVVMYVIKINGMNTINHDMIPSPDAHKTFNATVKIIITRNFKNAVLISPLNISISI